MAEKTVAAPAGDGTVARAREQSRETTREQERFVSPPVDIFENEEGLVLMADLPGVSRDQLEIEVKDDILTLQGRPAHSSSGLPVYQEFELPSYFRQFQLSDTVDTSRIRAELKDGVLTLRLPKAEAAKPKRIQVQAA